LLHRAVWWKFTNVSEVLTASISGAMMEAASTSEMSVKFYQTTHSNNPEDSSLLLPDYMAQQPRRQQSKKSYKICTAQ
jgi:hypothetical protein